MTLKEIFEYDWSTFINLEEFGEEIEIDGVELAAVKIEHTGNLNVNSPTQSYAKTSIHTNLHGVNLIGEQMTLYFETEKYTATRGQIPKHSEFVKVNGKRYRVEESIEAYGITRLTLSSDRMNIPKMEL